MEKTAMKEKLVEQATALRDELISIEQQFNQKKEQFLKIQGALEALEELEG
jgi:hypothetical protein